MRQVWTNNHVNPVTSKYKFSLNSAVMIGNRAWVGALIERTEVNTDPAFPAAPVRVTARVLAALQQPDGSLRYTPLAFMWLRFVNSEQLGMAAGAMGLTPALFFNARCY